MSCVALSRLQAGNMSEENKPSSAGETSRPKGNLQIQRIVEATTEKATCKRCKKSTPLCFTIDGFPNSKLCRTCGIYCKKYPTTFISKDVWTEPRIYAAWKYFFLTISFLWTVLFQCIFFRPYLDILPYPTLIFYAFNFGLLTSEICKFRTKPNKGILQDMVVFYVAKADSVLNALRSYFFLTETDYCEDTKYVTDQKMAAKEEEVAKLINELDNLEQEMADLLVDCQSNLVSCDDFSNDFTLADLIDYDAMSDCSDDESSSDESDFIVVFPVTSGPVDHQTKKIIDTSQDPCSHGVKV